MKTSPSKALLLALGLTIQPLASLAQAVVTYDIGWSASSGSTIFGYGQMVISGTPTAFSRSGLPSWLQSLSLNLTIGGTSGYLASQEDIDSFEWSSSSTPTSVSDITAFRFSATVSDLGSPEFNIVFGSGAVEVTATPSGGSPQTMSLTSFSAVPEPEEWAAIASGGLLAFALWHRRTRRAAKD